MGHCGKFKWVMAVVIFHNQELILHWRGRQEGFEEADRLLTEVFWRGRPVKEIGMASKETVEKASEDISKT